MHREVGMTEYLSPALGSGAESRSGPHSGQTLAVRTLCSRTAPAPGHLTPTKEAQFQSCITCIAGSMHFYLQGMLCRKKFASIDIHELNRLLSTATRYDLAILNRINYQALIRSFGSFSMQRLQRR